MNGEHKAGGGVSPAFVTARQAAALLGISERSLHALRAKGLVPLPLDLGPRSQRWITSELIEHVKANAPRGMQAEPAHLRRGKIEALKARGVPA